LRRASSYETQASLTPDRMPVGPLHGTHEPPFCVCGSDQWGGGDGERLRRRVRRDDGRAHLLTI
jgi:hypothetical protein